MRHLIALCILLAVVDKASAAGCQCCLRDSPQAAWNLKKLDNFAGACDSAKAIDLCTRMHFNFVMVEVYPRLGFPVADPLPRGRDCDHLAIEMQMKAVGLKSSQPAPLPQTASVPRPRRLTPLATADDKPAPPLVPQPPPSSRATGGAAAASSTARRRTHPLTDIASGGGGALAPRDQATGGNSAPQAPLGNGGKAPQAPLSNGGGVRPVEQMHPAEEQQALPAVKVHDYVARHVRDPFLQLLGTAALEHDITMDENFAYHNSVHARKVGQGAKLLAAELGANPTVQDAAFVAGLYHDTGYQEAVQANGYKILTDPQFDFAANSLTNGRPSANRKHEEFSLCWALKGINTLLASEQWRRHEFSGHTNLDEVISMIWAGIMVTKVAAPTFTDMAFEHLAKLQPYGGVNQPEFKLDEGIKCKIGAEIQKVFEVRPELQDKLKGEYLELFKAIKKSFGEGNAVDARFEHNLQRVALAMKGADFIYFAEPGAVCIAENCREEWSLFGGTASMMFPPDKWKGEFAALQNAGWAAQHLKLAELFWLENGGNGAFMKRMTELDNPLLPLRGRDQIIKQNMADADDIRECLRSIVQPLGAPEQEKNGGNAGQHAGGGASAGESAEQKLLRFKRVCLARHCRESRIKLATPAGDQGTTAQWMTMYGVVYEPVAARAPSPPARAVRAPAQQ